MGNKHLGYLSILKTSFKDDQKKSFVNVIHYFWHVFKDTTYKRTVEKNNSIVNGSTLRENIPKM